MSLFLGNTYKHWEIKNHDVQLLFSNGSAKVRIMRLIKIMIKETMNNNIKQNVRKCPKMVNLFERYTRVQIYRKGEKRYDWERNGWAYSSIFWEGPDNSCFRSGGLLVAVTITQRCPCSTDSHRQQHKQMGFVCSNKTLFTKKQALVFLTLDTDAKDWPCGSKCWEMCNKEHKIHCIFSYMFWHFS